MRRNRFNHALACFCLIWFGLTSTVFAGGLVLCQDGHGDMRFELGCDQNSVGECLTSCGGETGDEPGRPHPCEDTLIEVDLSITTAPQRSTSDLAVGLPMAVAALAFRTDPPTLARAAWTCSGPGRPPSVLTHIRSVILLV